MIKNCPICNLLLVQFTINSRIKYHCTDNLNHHFYIELELESKNKIKAICILYNNYYIAWDLEDKKKLSVSSLSEVSLPSSKNIYWKADLNYIEPNFDNLKSQFNLIIDKYNLLALFK